MNADSLSSFLDVCNFIKGSSLTFSESFLPLFLGRPMVVSSWPFGRPLLRMAGGIVIPTIICLGGRGYNY